MCARYGGVRAVGVCPTVGRCGGVPHSACARCGGMPPAGDPCFSRRFRSGLTIRRPFAAARVLSCASSTAACPCCVLGRGLADSSRCWRSSGAVPAQHFALQFRRSCASLGAPVRCCRCGLVGRIALEQQQRTWALPGRGLAFDILPAAVLQQRCVIDTSFTCGKGRWCVCYNRDKASRPAWPAR